MKLSVRKGFSFGLTSGIITTLGLMVGLEAGIGSSFVVLGGILTIAVADALSDALGIHMSEESEYKKTDKDVWESTLATFLTKFVFALTFVVPVLLLPLFTAIIVSVVWGLLIISLTSWHMAVMEKKNPLHIVSEHVLITLVVIVVTYFVGKLVPVLFS